MQEIKEQKIHILGGYSKFIILPTEWCKKHKLKNDSKVNIEIHKDYLVIRP